MIRQEHISDMWWVGGLNFKAPLHSEMYQNPLSVERHSGACTLIKVMTVEETLQS